LATETKPYPDDGSIDSGREGPGADTASFFELLKQYATGRTGVENQLQPISTDLNRFPRIIIIITVLLIKLAKRIGI